MRIRRGNGTRNQSCEIPVPGTRYPYLSAAMLARALRTPLRNAARAVAPTASRAFSATPGEHLKEIKNVKLKDVPEWVSEAKADPRTEEAAKVSFWLFVSLCFPRGRRYFGILDALAYILTSI